LRPVNKGDSPYKSIKKYQEAIPYLEDKIGNFCSYCELIIDHVPEVEHKAAKSKEGNLTDWGNLLIACKYCNSRKNDNIGKANKSDWIFPDENNTLLAFRYDNGMVKVNNEYLSNVDSNLRDKAQNMIDILQLNNIPDNRFKIRDKRVKLRLEVLSVANESLLDWLEVKSSNNLKSISIQKNNIIKLALKSGFFSIWFMIFKDEVEIKEKLIHSFIGTDTICFNEKMETVPKNINSI